MRDADEYAGRYAAQLRQNESKPDEVTGAAWARCYRLMVMQALQSIPPEVFPADVAVKGIIVRAAELIPWGLYIACGNQEVKGFIGGGAADLWQWLYRCEDLFIHVAEIADDLPRGDRGHRGAV